MAEWQPFLDLGCNMTTLDWPVEPPTLEGDALRLRAWTSADVDAVFAACQDLETQRWTTVPVPYLRAHAVGFVDTMAPEQWAARTGALFCIAAVDDDRVLGSCGLVAIDEENRVAEVGYWVAPAARGSGVAQRACELLATWAFQNGGVCRLELYIDPGNVASCHVAERVGGVREGASRRILRRDGTPVDVVPYALVDDRWIP